MRYAVIAYAEERLPRKEVEITAKTKDQVWSQAWKMFPEYHEIGVFEID